MEEENKEIKTKKEKVLAVTFRILQISLYLIVGALIAWFFFATRVGK